MELKVRFFPLTASRLYVVADDYYQPYLEAQTEWIFYALQNVLSGVRAPTPSPTLNENLTQTITIISGIAAVRNDNLPLVSAQQSNELLREPSEYANKLNRVQAMLELTMGSRQIIASWRRTL